MCGRERVVDRVVRLAAVDVARHLNRLLWVRSEGYVVSGLEVLRSWVRLTDEETLAVLALRVRQKWQELSR